MERAPRLSDKTTEKHTRPAGTKEHVKRQSGPHHERHHAAKPTAEQAASAEMTQAEKEQFARDMLERELSYERDPGLRQAEAELTGQVAGATTKPVSDDDSDGLKPEERAIRDYERWETQRRQLARRRFDYWFAVITAVVVALLLITWFIR